MGNCSDDVAIMGYILLLSSIGCLPLLYAVGMTYPRKVTLVNLL